MWGGGGRLISDWALVTEAYNRAGREFGGGGGGGADNWKGYRWAGGGDFQLNIRCFEFNPVCEICEF